MRVLFLANPGSIHDRKWINYFAENHEFEVFLITRAIHSKSALLSEMHSNVKNMGSIPDFSLRKFARTIRTLIFLRQLIKSNKIDVFNCHYAEPNALWFGFKSILGSKCIITTLGTDILQAIPLLYSKKDPLNRLVFLIYKRAFVSADFVIGTSVSQLEVIRSIFKRFNKLEVIRTGVDLDRLRADTIRYYPLTNTKPYILFPRAISPIYNHEFCLEAIGMLPSEITRKYRMVFVGKNAGDTQYQSTLERTIQQLPHVQFEFLEKQSQEALFELYKRSSLVVMTPKSDGSPVSAMEALLVGKPIIMGPLSYDKDIYNLNSFVLKTWSADELAKLIYNVLQFEVSILPNSVVKKMSLSSNMKLMLNIYQIVLKVNI